MLLLLVFFLVVVLIVVLAFMLLRGRQEDFDPTGAPTQTPDVRVVPRQLKSSFNTLADVLRQYGIQDSSGKEITFPQQRPDLQIGFLTLPGIRPPMTSLQPTVLSGYNTEDYVKFFEITGAAEIDPGYLSECMEAVDVFDASVPGSDPSAFTNWGDRGPGTTRVNETLILQQTALLQNLLMVIRPRKIYWIPIDIRLNSDTTKQKEFHDRLNRLGIGLYLISHLDSEFDATLLSGLEGMKVMGTGNGCATDPKYVPYYTNPTLLQVGRLDNQNKPLLCSSPTASSHGYLNAPRPLYQTELNPVDVCGIPDASIIGEGLFYYSYQNTIISKDDLLSTEGSQLSAVALASCYLLHKDWFDRFLLDTTDPSSPRFYKTFFYQNPELFVYVNEGMKNRDECLKYSDHLGRCSSIDLGFKFQKWNFISGLGFPNCSKWGRLRRYLTNSFSFPLTYQIDGQTITVPPMSMTGWFTAKSVKLQGTVDCYCADPAVLKTGSTPVKPVSCLDYCLNDGNNWGGSSYSMCATGISRIDGRVVPCNIPSLATDCYCAQPLTSVVPDDQSTTDCFQVCNQKGFDRCAWSQDATTLKIGLCTKQSGADPIQCLCAGKGKSLTQKEGNDGNTSCNDFCSNRVKASGPTFSRCYGGFGTAGDIRQNFGCDDIPLEAYPLGERFVCECDQPVEFKKNMDGKRSCTDYCLNRGGEWGPTYAGCVEGRDPKTGTSVACNVVYNQPIDCYCQPETAVLKPGSDGTQNCSDFCRNRRNVVGTTYGHCVRSMINGREIQCSTIYGETIDGYLTGIPSLVVEDSTPLSQIRFYPVGQFDIHWSYKKDGTNFDFPEDPTISPVKPPSATIWKRRRNPEELYTEFYESHGTDICGSLIITDSNRSNTYHLVIDHYKDLGGWARGLIPYVQVWNMTQNDLTVDFYDQSATKNPSKMTLGPGAEDAFNMETGVRRSTEINIVVPVAAALATFLVAVATGAGIASAAALLNDSVDAAGIELTEQSLSEATGVEKSAAGSGSPNFKGYAPVAEEAEGGKGGQNAFSNFINALREYLMGRKLKVA